MSLDVSGEILTVLGPISPETAGRTLAHEHLSVNSTALMVKNTEGLAFPELCSKPVTTDILWWIYQHPYSSYANSQLCEERQAVTEEVKFFKENGGGCIVENTTIGLHRDIDYLAQVSMATGVHVVAGTGYYVEPSRPQTINLSQEEMAVTMATELTQGCDGTEIRAGIVGEIGCSFPLMNSEKNAVQAAGQVESDLGCPVTIHPGRDASSPWEIVRLYQEAGGRVDKLVMSHMDRTIHDIGEILEFAKVGCFLDYDLFGIETSHYQQTRDVDMPSDAQRIQRIRALVDAGHEDQITVGHDIHTKHRLMKYGGHGYSHILLHVAPKMLTRGITQQVVDKILLDNPQRWLTFR